MKTILKAVLVAGALAVTSAGAMAPANAAVSFGFSFNGGNVAFGYSDGYWDRYHRWHSWRNDQERRYYMSHYRGHYYNYGHDRYRNQGWRR